MLYSKISGEGFPVLLIHGLFGMNDNLAMVARPLAERYQVHSLDLRNHGRSPRAESMGFEEMAADVVAYMDANGIDTAHLIGHSLGGKVAMQLALAHPWRVSRLIVADISPVDYLDGAHDEIFTAINAVDLTLLRSRRDAESVLDQYINDPMVKLFIMKNLYRNEQGQFDWRINVEVLQRCYAQLRSGIDVEAPFQGDTLFIKGGDSPYIQDKHRDTIFQLFPKAQMAVIEGAGHWLHAEKTVEFNQVVSGFLNP